MGCVKVFVGSVKKFEGNFETISVVENMSVTCLTFRPSLSQSPRHTSIQQPDSRYITDGLWATDGLCFSR